MSYDELAVFPESYQDLRPLLCFLLVVVVLADDPRAQVSAN